MKRTKLFSPLFLILFTILFSVTACDKDDDTTDTSGGICPSSVAFCMEYGGLNKSGAAALSQPPGGRYRVYWENTVNGVFEQVELDIYGSANGDYSVDTTAASGTAVFEYFSSTDGANKGISGTVKVTTFDPTGTGISGSFTLSTQNGTAVTNGHFVNVK